MNIVAINALLEIVSEEIDNVNVKDNNSVKVVNKHRNKYVDDLLEIYGKEVEKLQEQRNFEENIFKEDSVKKCIFKSLNVIFKSTTQEERVFHFDRLIKNIYDFFVQKLLDLKQYTSVIPLKEFKNIVRKYIPLVKLDIALYGTKEDINTKQIRQEVLEYLKTPNILREDVYEISRNAMRHQYFKLQGYDLQFMNIKLGYLGEYAKLKVHTEIENEIVTFNCFIKYVPTGDSYLQNLIAVPSFIKEELFYMKFVPLLEKLGITDLDCLPKCYLVTNNFVVLEDLSISGYSGVQGGILDYEHLSMAFRQLAKLHSLSILAEEKLSEKLETKIEINNYLSRLITETQIIPNDFTHSLIEHTIHFLDKFPHIVKDITVEEFKNVARKKLNAVFGMVGNSKNYKNVVSHSDLWANNIFYKWNNSRPQECVLLDYQLIRYCPQVMDLLMILHITSTKDIREKYSKILLRDYYDTLNFILKKYDVNIEKISSFGDLLKSFEEFKIFGIYVGTTYNYFLPIPKHKMDEIDGDPEKNLKYWTDYKYKGEVLNSIWDELDCIKKFEENAQDLYELCVKQL